MGVGRMFGRNGDPIREPAYIRTTPFDGGKYIDPKTFLEDEDIQKQLEWFEQSDGDSQPERLGD
jgi:hypothetical protein